MKKLDCPAVMAFNVPMPSGPFTVKTLTGWLLQPWHLNAPMPEPDRTGYYPLLDFDVPKEAYTAMDCTFFRCGPAAEEDRGALHWELNAQGAPYDVLIEAEPGSFIKVCGRIRISIRPCD